ncbi:hypothetical protein EF908_20400, partial [Streptomyces sp. WAC04770]
MSRPPHTSLPHTSLSRPYRSLTDRSRTPPTGFGRSAVVAAAIGTIGPTADGYAVGNALPTVVYML